MTDQELADWLTQAPRRTASNVRAIGRQAGAAWLRVTADQRTAASLAAAETAIVILEWRAARAGAV